MFTKRFIVFVVMLLLIFIQNYSLPFFFLLLHTNQILTNSTMLQSISADLFLDKDSSHGPCPRHNRHISFFFCMAFGFLETSYFKKILNRVINKRVPYPSMISSVFRSIHPFLKATYFEMIFNTIKY